MNGGLWCSPVAKTSRPISSAFLAIATVALIRSCSLGVRPVVGSVVTSPTVKMPICMTTHFFRSTRRKLVESATVTGTRRLAPLFRHRLRQDHHIAEVPLAVPVLTGDEHQAAGNLLTEEPL